MLRKPLEIELHVSLDTVDPAEAREVKRRLGNIVSAIEEWLEAPSRLNSRPAPLSAETPGDRENAGIEAADDLAAWAAKCNCPRCTAKRARAQGIPANYDTDTERAAPPTIAEVLRAEIVSDMKATAEKMERLAEMIPTDGPAIMLARLLAGRRIQ